MLTPARSLLSDAISLLSLPHVLYAYLKSLSMYHEWRILDKCIHIYMWNKNTLFLHQCVPHTSFSMICRSSTGLLPQKPIRRVWLFCDFVIRIWLWLSLQFDQWLFEVAVGWVFRVQRYFNCRAGFFSCMSHMWCSKMNWWDYFSRFSLFHFDTESDCGAFETEIMATWEHEDVLRYFLTLWAGLRLLH